MTPKLAEDESDKSSHSQECSSEEEAQEGEQCDGMSNGEGSNDRSNGGGSSDAEIFPELQHTEGVEEKNVGSSAGNELASEALEDESVTPNISSVNENGNENESQSEKATNMEVGEDAEGKKETPMTESDTIKYYHCDKCPKKYLKRPQMVRHLRWDHLVDTPELYTCEVCSKVYKYKGAYEEHKRVHVDPYQCKHCKVGFPLPHLLDNHMRSRHKRRRRKKAPARPRIWKCSICSAPLRSSFALKRHMQIHEKEDPSEFTCHICSKSYKYRANIVTHLQIHDETKVLKCAKCPKVFVSLSTLEKHLQSHCHDRSRTCEFCFKTFSTGSSLLRHAKSHMQIKDFECKICFQPFTQKSVMVTHMLSHTGDKPFCCEYCFKCFYTNSKLITHLRVHTDEKKYKCDLCPKSFLTQYSLIFHSRSHYSDRSNSTQDILKEFKMKKILSGLPYNLKEYQHFMFDKFEDLTKYESTDDYKMRFDPGFKLSDLDDILKKNGCLSYVCPICSQSFSQRLEFTGHLRSHPQVLPLSSVLTTTPKDEPSTAGSIVPKKILLRPPGQIRTVKIISTRGPNGLSRPPAQAQLKRELPGLPESQPAAGSKINPADFVTTEIKQEVED